MRVKVALNSIGKNLAVKVWDRELTASDDLWAVARRSLVDEFYRECEGDLEPMVSGPIPDEVVISELNGTILVRWTIADERARRASAAR